MSLLNFMPGEGPHYKGHGDRTGYRPQDLSVAGRFNAHFVEHFEGPDAKDRLADEITQTGTVDAPDCDQADFQNDFDSQRPEDESPVLLFGVEGGQHKSVLRIDEHQACRPDQELEWNDGAGELRSGRGDDHRLGAGRYED